MAAISEYNDYILMTKDEKDFVPENHIDETNSFLRPHQSVKREKSYAESNEREKKRVKFNPNPTNLGGEIKTKRGKNDEISKPPKQIKKGILKNQNIELTQYKQGIGKKSKVSFSSEDKADFILNKDHSEEFLESSNRHIYINRQNIINRKSSSTLKLNSNKVDSQDNRNDANVKRFLGSSILRNCNATTSTNSTLQLPNKVNKKNDRLIKALRKRVPVILPKINTFPAIINGKERKVPPSTKQHLLRDQVNNNHASSSKLNNGIYRKPIKPGAEESLSKIKPKQ